MKIEQHLMKAARWIPSNFIVWMAAFFAIVALCVLIKRRLAFIKRCNIVPGTVSSYPIIGNATKLLLPPDGIFA